ncbi:MAG: SET domain-containing protein-lysine N-methyltransferase [Paracoccaceae bacterium]
MQAVTQQTDQPANELITTVRALNEGNVSVKPAPEPKGRGVFARRAFREGEVVVAGIVEGIAKQRTNFSIQLFWNVHANFEEPAVVINHSCGPNVAVVPNELGAYSFVAVTAIDEGAEICFDYATTEYESIAVPECHCGAPQCRGKSGGYILLPDEHELKMRGLVAPYLRDSRAGKVLDSVITFREVA